MSQSRTIEIEQNQTIGAIYTADEVREAMERVENKADWKAAIDATIEVVGSDWPQQLAKIAFAIEFYTATKAEFTPLGISAGKLVVRVQAAGYRAGPAGG